MKRLRVAIDASELEGRPTGVGRTVTAVLAHWIHRADVEAVLVARRRDQLPAFLREACEVVTFPFPSHLIAWQQLALPALIRAAKVDVLYAPNYATPLLSGVPAVVALHDVSYEHDPSAFTPREAARRRALARLAARRAALIVTGSRTAASEIERFYPHAASKVRVVPYGVDDRFAAVGLWSQEQRRAAAERLLEQCRLSDPYVLHVGTVLNRRHLPELISGFARHLNRRENTAGLTETANEQPTKLVIAGANRTQPQIDLAAVAAEAGINNRLVLLDWVDESLLIDLYACAAAFLWLSDYEGFGLPPLEAMAAGVPTAVLDTSASAEMFRGHALLIKDLEVESIAAALDLLAKKPHEGLRERHDLLAKFDWASSAQQLLQVLNEALGEAGELASGTEDPANDHPNSYPPGRVAPPVKDP